MHQAHSSLPDRAPDALVPLLAHAERRVRLGALEGLRPHLTDAVRLVVRGLAETDPDDVVRDRSRALLAAWA